MTKIFHQALIFLVVILIVSCRQSKNETVTEDSVVNETTTVEEPDSTDDDFNNQDYGDPGLSAMIVDHENLDEDVRNFLLRLDNTKISEVLEAGKDILLLSPGPGVYPVVEFGNSSKDLLAIKEISAFLSDSTHKELKIYRALQDNKCIVIEGYPDGIYFGYSDFKKFTEVNANSDNETLNKRLNSFTKDTSEKSGYEFVLKFTSATGEPLFVDIITFKKDGKLFIGAIDQRDCGA